MDDNIDIAQYLKTINLKKIPKVGIHFEQKTTPDLLWCVAQVIIDLTKKNHILEFTDKENVRNSPIFENLMGEYFCKPPQIEAENEYNKVSSYQLGLLVYSGILEQTGSRPKKYSVSNYKILKYIAVNDLNASKFLTEYTEKFLYDNGLLKYFNNYKIDSNQENYLKAKKAYWDWAKKNTAVRGSKKTHTYRVFNKIFNVFCYKNRIPGEDASNITSGPCPYTFLIYNRTNFRDKDMPNGVTRNEYNANIISEINKDGVVETLVLKSKESLKAKYSNTSEIQDKKWGFALDRVSEVHHILPRHSYPQFSLCRENMIVLTPDQHRSFAHEGNNKLINYEFQGICLLYKFLHIIESIRKNEDFYCYNDFISIINSCYKLKLMPDTDYKELKEAILDGAKRLEMD